MALIKCPECGKEISDKAESCIYCGYPLKEKVTIQSVQVRKEPIESHVLAYRCGPGSVTAIYFVGLILGLMIIIAYLVLGIIFGGIIWLSLSFLAILAVFLIALSVYGLIKVGANASNRRNCIEYDAQNRKFVLCTLWGKEIIIDPSDYVELKDNFLTDNMLMFTYRLPSGQLKKVNLGACADRGGLRGKISKVIDNLKQ